jgi:hypothetical protein
MNRRLKAENKKAAVMVVAATKNLNFKDERKKSMFPKTTSVVLILPNNLYIESKKVYTVDLCGFF